MVARERPVARGRLRRPPVGLGDQRPVSPRLRRAGPRPAVLVRRSHRVEAAEALPQVVAEQQLAAPLQPDL